MSVTGWFELTSCYMSDKGTVFLTNLHTTNPQGETKNDTRKFLGIPSERHSPMDRSRRIRAENYASSKRTACPERIVNADIRPV